MTHVIRIVCLGLSLLVLGMVVLGLDVAKHTDAQAAAAEFEESNISLSLLHFSPVLASSTDDIQANVDTIKEAMTLAKKSGVDWFMTPELTLTGYRFKYHLGTDWIKPGVDQWTKQLQTHADKLDLVLFLSHIEQDPVTLKRYNTLFVIDREGRIASRHRKINTIPGSESWSSTGDQPTIALVDSYKVGLLICADAWPEQHAHTLKEKGAEIILSSANWAPGEYGPGDTWINRAQENLIPFVVNNRTGMEGQLDMNKATSVVIDLGMVDDKNKMVKQPQIAFEHHSEQAALVVVNMDINTQKLQGTAVTYLRDAL